MFYVPAQLSPNGGPFFRRMNIQSCFLNILAYIRSNRENVYKSTREVSYFCLCKFGIIGASRNRIRLCIKIVIDRKINVLRNLSLSPTRGPISAGHRIPNKSAQFAPKRAIVVHNISASVLNMIVLAIIFSLLALHVRHQCRRKPWAGCWRRAVSDGE
jgi:hypothetical protein